MVLDLEPHAAAPAGLVARIEPFGHHSLEAGLRARVEHRLAGAFLVWRRLPRLSAQLQLREQPPALRIRLLEQASAFVPEQVEDHVDHRDYVHLPADLRLRRQSHALLDLLEAGPALLVERHDLAVEDDLARSERAAHRMHLGIARRDLLTGPAHQPHAPSIDVRNPANAVPLELEAPTVVGGGKAGRNAGHHRLDTLRDRLAIRILRRIHPVDHPVVAASLKKDVSAFQPLAMEFDHDLTVSPFDSLVSARVPDGDRPAPVLALWDLTRELEVLERVVFHVHGQVVLFRVGWNAFRHCPRHTYPILLQPQVPVQATCVMLLDDKAQRFPRGPGNLRTRFGRALEIPLGLVLGELAPRHAF